jgi:transposase
MYVDSCTYTSGGKQYSRHLLRESFRTNGKVAHRTLANLSHCSQAEIRAIKLALKHKHNLQQLGNINEDICVQQGVSCGAVVSLWQVAQRIGLVDALGFSQDGKRALWQLFARVLEQGSRLSAVRLANAHAACDILELDDFDEDDLYDNLDWLAEHQEEIEDRLFYLRYGTQKPDLYLYDVTSSYLEGVCNALAAFGYSRDGKSGKMQVVYGLLCDFQGVPISIQAFPGNTADTKTFGKQVHKVTQRFGGKSVTFVGDRGMIKGPQIQQLQADQEHEFHYITAITKTQVESLLKRGVIQCSLFDETVAEVFDGNVRYVLRRNPERAEEMAAGRKSKLASLQKLVDAKNAYLASHPRASVAAAQQEIEAKQKKLRLPDVKLTVAERTFTLAPEADAWTEAAKLDGCYCLKTDVLPQQASKETIHERYKDLAHVEWAFRTSKTGLLEARPFYVRLETRTRGHLLVVMLAYLLVQELAKCWRDLELTVEEGLEELKSLCTTRVTVKGQSVLHNVPEPRESVQRLLDAAHVTLPKTIADRGVRVSTRKKLVDQRQPRRKKQLAPANSET